MAREYTILVPFIVGEKKLIFHMHESAYDSIKKNGLKSGLDWCWGNGELDIFSADEIEIDPSSEDLDRILCKKFGIDHDLLNSIELV